MTAARPSSRTVSMLEHEAVREAVRLALVMRQTLPVAAKPGGAFGVGFGQGARI